nr:GNAT family N-acetyltransferase [uncultured Actinoplanes sp.]
MRISVERLVTPRDAYAVARTGWEFDHPDIPFMSPADFLARVASESSAVRVERFLGRVDGVPAGYLAVELPQRDNLDNAQIELTVVPSQRRLGLGRALLDAARALGRRHLVGMTADRHPDGAAFAAATGAVLALEEVRLRLEVTATEPARLQRLLAEAWAHAGGYRLILWTGMPPAEIVEGVAELQERFRGEAPIGELAWEEEKVDAQRVRQVEEELAARGRLSVHTGVLHEERLVAHTTLVAEGAGATHAWQRTTLVDPRHRGHRLGLLIKLANLAHAREMCPELAAVETFTARSNEHMNRINEAMGFRPVGALSYWQWTG